MKIYSDDPNLPYKTTKLSFTSEVWRIEANEAASRKVEPSHTFRER